MFDSRDDEAETIRLVKAGDADAANRLVRAFTDLVSACVRSHVGQGLSMVELLEAGNVGLVVAAQRYHERGPYRFASYSIWWVRLAILEAVNKRNPPG